MKKLSFALLIFIGLMNFVPIIGVISAEQVGNLYGIGVDSAALETLLRHRAVMLGLIGGFILVAAFRPSIRVPATVIGLVSMGSFIVLAYTTGDAGSEINKVAVADMFGCVAAVVVLLIETRSSDDSR